MRHPKMSPPCPALQWDAGVRQGSVPQFPYQEKQLGAPQLQAAYAQHLGITEHQVSLPEVHPQPPCCPGL